MVSKLTLNIITVLLGATFFVLNPYSLSFVGSAVIGLFGLVLIVINFGLMIYFIRIFFKQKPFFNKEVISIMVSLLIADLLLVAGSYRTRSMVQESKDLGTSFILQVNQYVEKGHSLPERTERLSELGLELPEIPIPNSSLVYKKLSDNEFSLSFDAPAWLVCRRINLETQWVCDD